jgi:3-hydroxyisobutyrate dehydrogenase-like beta-hydroxyacid dehydrogenase
MRFHEEATKAGKASSSNPPTTLAEAVTTADFVIVVLQNEPQCESVCFGEGSSLFSLLSSGACVILCSTVTAVWSQAAEHRFASKSILFVDCPISGGPVRAQEGTLVRLDERGIASAVYLLFSLNY